MNLVAPEGFALPPGSIDRERAIATLRMAIGRASVTGDEANFVEMLAETLSEVGVSGVTVRDFLPGRPNIWGVRKGAGGGRCLLLIGHTDVVHVRGWRERWAGTEREDPFGAPARRRRDLGPRRRRPQGRHLRRRIEALRASRPRRRRSLPATSSSLSSATRRAASRARGVSAGMKAFVAGHRSPAKCRGRTSPSMSSRRTLDVYSAQMGFFIADIEVTGRTAYFGVPELGVDALKAAHAILAALWAHSADLESTRRRIRSIGRSFLLVTAHRGWRPDRRAGAHAASA